VIDLTFFPFEPQRNSAHPCILITLTYLKHAPSLGLGLGIGRFSIFNDSDWIGGTKKPHKIWSGHP